MLQLLSKTNTDANFKPRELEILLAKIAQIYAIDDIEETRKEYLEKAISKYGYLPYPQFKVLEELTPAETIFSLLEKLKYSGMFKNSKIVDFKNPSVLARKNIKNSNWFKHEGHNIKLLSLSALGNGDNDEKAGHFIDWLKCLVTLPSGNSNLGIMADTIYLIPFTEREFDCAYLPKSSEISQKLEDTNLYKFLGLDKTAQVKLFIELAQLAGHPVIYDILPQTARFSKMILAHPELARWIDVNELTLDILNKLQEVCVKLSRKRKYKKEDVQKAQKIYEEMLKGKDKRPSKALLEIIDNIEKELKDYKIQLSWDMSYSKKQKNLQKRVRKAVEVVNGKTPKTEEDIVHQDEIIQFLISAGLWTNCGGAWCSSGIPIFDKMSSGAKYPIFKHYDYKGEDVTHFANLDCQTPFYFYNFELNTYNKDVVDFYIQYTEKLQETFNFDGFRVDHIDHIVDPVSQNDKGQPISYRIPAKVLGKINSNMKKKVPYFATLAEYMLWDGYFREYHKDMHFDLLWGDDIVAQSSKTPEQIINDNLRLSEYNKKQGKLNPLSILKAYNNQDGEFRDISQYPGQLGPQGALFKWFKLKFLPGGKYASRPVMYIDGDESFTKTGIERIISKEVSMKREYDWDFWEKFSAINMFSQNDKLLNQGRASLLKQDKNGFCAWEVISENKKDEDINYSYLVVANYLNPTEMKDKKQEKGKTTKENTLSLPKGKKLVSYYDFDLDEMYKCTFSEHTLGSAIEKEITFHELKPAEFKVYKMI